MGVVSAQPVSCSSWESFGTHIYPGDPEFLLFRLLCRYTKARQSSRKGKEGPTQVLSSVDSRNKVSFFFKRRVPLTAGSGQGEAGQGSQRPISPFHGSFQSEKEASREHDRWLQNLEGCLNGGNRHGSRALKQTRDP